MKQTKKFFSDRTVTNILYVLAVVVIISVIIVTVVAFTSQRTPKKNVITTTSSVQTDPDVTTGPSTDKDKPTTGGTTDGGKKDEPKDPATDVVKPIELIMPCSGALNKHHDLENLAYSMTMDDYRTHAGIDITVDEGTPVKACESGKVIAVYYDPFMGYCIEIDHGSGFLSVYKNLADELPDGIVEGCTVSKGQTIGAVGSTAIVEQADEAHLHFELSVNGEAVNPLDYIDYSEETMSPIVEDK